ncbi:MAG: hypothetical protein FWG64_11630 [Firmicutes bacterium]|nr:hypothetical protein [Bacillota bacterium]
MHEKCYRLSESTAITYENSTQIFEQCFAHANYFTLTQQTSYFCGYERVFNKPSVFPKGLIDNFIAEILTANWHCFQIFDFDKETGKPLLPFAGLRVSLFKATEQAKKAILQNANNIFFTIESAEDICFFANNQLFLGTLSHEFMCNFYPQTVEMFEQFSKYAIWQEYSRLLGEKILLSDFFGETIGE